MATHRSSSSTSRPPTYGNPTPVPIATSVGLPDFPCMLQAALVLADSARSPSLTPDNELAYILAGGERRAIRISPQRPHRTSGHGGRRTGLLSEAQERHVLDLLMATTAMPLRPVLSTAVAAVIGIRPNRRWIQRFLRRHGFRMPAWQIVRGRRA